MLMIAQFIGLYPAAVDLNVMADLSLRRLFCNFLCGSLLTVLARREVNMEHQVMKALSWYFHRLTMISFNTISICERR